MDNRQLLVPTKNSKLSSENYRIWRVRLRWVLLRVRNILWGRGCPRMDAEIHVYVDVQSLHTGLLCILW